MNPPANISRITVDQVQDIASQIELSARKKPMLKPHIKNVDGKFTCPHGSENKSRKVTWSSHKVVIAFDYHKLTATTYTQQCKLCNRHVKPVIQNYDYFLYDALWDEKQRKTNNLPKKDGQVEDNIEAKKTQPAHPKHLCSVCQMGVAHV